MKKTVGSKKFRMLAVSDLHLDWSTAGVRRYDDVSRQLDRVYEVVHDTPNDSRFDAVFCLGDIANPERVQSHRAVARCIEWSTEIQAAGAEPMWLVGNHDVVEDGSGGHVLEAVVAAGFTVFSEPTVLELAPGLELMALPFTPRARAYDPGEFVKAAARGARDLAPKTKRPAMLVIGHLYLNGIHPGSETTDLPRGREIMWPLAELAEHYPNAMLVAGHHHQAQVFQGVVPEQKLHIVGSLERLTFGEEHHRKSFFTWEIEL
jgi:DNA repair exonuclease SbcCD nuclease subunit